MVYFLISMCTQMGKEWLWLNRITGWRALSEPGQS